MSGLRRVGPALPALAVVAAVFLPAVVAAFVLGAGLTWAGDVLAAGVVVASVAGGTAVALRTARRTTRGA